MGYNEHFSRAVCFWEVSTKMLVGYLKQLVGKPEEEKQRLMEQFAGEIEATSPYEPGKEPEYPGSDDEEDADPEEGEIPQLRVNPDGSVDFQTVSDWWAEMGQKCNTDWFRIGVDKKDEGRGNG